jgi:hypothetical protein
MAKSIRTHMDTLRSLAPELNTAIDDANALIKAADAILGELNLGVSAQTFVSVGTIWEDEDGLENSEDWYLAYGRIRGGSYHIHLLARTFKRVPDDNERNGFTWQVTGQEPFEWSTCPREQRLQAIDRLPDLLEEIARELKDLIDKTAAAKTAAAEMLEDLQ